MDRDIFFRMEVLENVDGGDSGGDDETFVSSDNLKEVDVLPFYQPPWGPPSVIARAREGRSLEMFREHVDCVRKVSLNTHIQYVRNWSVANAKRELVQNLLDEVARGNASHIAEPSYDGIKISIGSRTRGRVKEETIVFHNDKEKLAEIIFVPLTKTLHFINYGAVVKKGRRILFYGETDKTGLQNQTGCYGEGLKRSIVKFISIGCEVAIEGCFPIKTGKNSSTHTYQSWKFRGHDSGDVTFSVSPKDPKQRLKGSKHCDRNRFEVTVRFSEDEDEDSVRVDIEDYIVPQKYLMSNPGSYVITDPEMRGQIHVKHFYVCTYQERYVRFSYDLDISVGRDRNDINFDHLVTAVAQCWSEKIRRDPDSAALLYAMLLEPNCQGYVEVRAIEDPAFSDEARDSIASFWRREHDIGELKHYPVESERQAIFFSCPTALCSPHMLNAITRNGGDGVQGAFEHPQQVIQQAHNRLVGIRRWAKSRSFIEKLSSMFHDILFSAGVSFTPIMFAWIAHDRKIVINTYRIDTSSDDDLINLIARMTVALPILLGREYNPRVFIENMLAKEKERIENMLALQKEPELQSQPEAVNVDVEVVNVDGEVAAAGEVNMGGDADADEGDDADADVVIISPPAAEKKSKKRQRVQADVEADGQDEGGQDEEAVQKGTDKKPVWVFTPPSPPENFKWEIQFHAVPAVPAVPK